MTPNPQPFDRFILLADMRTGSNFLEANLNAIPGLHCHGEVFNPHFIGKAGQTEYLGVTLAQRDADPFALLAALGTATDGLAGFRHFHDHDPRILNHALADRRCAKIVLTRNPLESYVSLKIAQATGQWRLGDVRRRKTALAQFDADEFAAHVDALQQFQLQIQHALQTSGQTAFYIGYEDINDLGVLNGLAAFLGIAGRLAALDDAVKKQNPEPLEDLVINPDDMVAGLRRLDRFNLGRTPNFEPRRSAAVPSYLAAAGAPVLYLPIRGGPEASLRDWLGRLGPQPGVIAGFNQRDLRRWQQTNPGAQSFTVLRHPLVRAHAAFCERILTNAAPAVRAVLKRQWKLDLPPPDRLDRLDPARHATAFLQFLLFLKANLTGQTAIHVDAAWASQLAVVQGFATLVPPMHLFREDQLSAGLGYLTASLGLPSVAVGDDSYAAPQPLASIVTAEHQAAARDAYARDYLAFGFDDWRPTTAEPLPAPLAMGG